MWALTISRADLVAAGACYGDPDEGATPTDPHPDSGLALFDRIAPTGTLILPPPGQEWTALHWRFADLLLRCTPHYPWCVARDLWRGADLGGADLRGAYLRGADLGGADLGDWERGPDGYARRKAPPTDGGAP